MKNSLTVKAVRRQASRATALAVLALTGVDSGLALAEEADVAPEWGPPIGAPIEVLQADDQDGNPRELSNLAGERGLLLFLSRSADW